jgi:RimJ/RimL family protein N-acetyltransferase
MADAPQQPRRASEGIHAIDIRPIGVDDSAGYFELLGELDHETKFLLWEPGERILDPTQLHARLKAADPATQLRLVAAHGPQLVGFLVANRGEVRRTHHRADFAMAVLAEYRRRSIGSRLLDALDHWAVEHHIARLELTVMSHNTPARALYERGGYRLEGIKRDAIIVDGRPIDECVMGKLL